MKHSLKFIHICCLLLISLTANAVTPVKNLLERIQPGASEKFILEQIKSSEDYFELDQKGDKVVIRGNNPVSIATGLNWYLKYHAGIHLSWNGMTAVLPESLPPVKEKERRATQQKYRYDFNYCTYSYSMAFWNWERWEKEIDWMALHGVNLPLSLVGTEGVWYNVLEKLGYSHDEINAFIPGPGFMAWWLMNNLEGWGGPNPKSWYESQIKLQQQILKRMREFGIEPVLAGYSGMVPRNSKEKMGLNIADPGTWCGFPRPAFLQPTDARFNEIATLYYKELTRLFGKANYYSMDPFHEGGSTHGIDLKKTGDALIKSMKKANPKAKWVIQAWQDNPRDQMIGHLPEGDILVLDLFGESRPQWGDPASSWYRPNGYGKHDWAYCMLLNFGGNIGLHGKMEHLIDGFYSAKESKFATTLKGVGMTMEGIENNPVMYELVMELPWRENRFTKDEWLKGYVKARYGKSDSRVQEAWILLSNSIYNCPKESTQEGTTESLFCARPGENVKQASRWVNSEVYYEADDVIRAARLMIDAADQFRGNNNFEYDLVDILRQAITEKGRRTYLEVMTAYHSNDKPAFERTSKKFLKLIGLQDQLLGTRPEFMVGTWINNASGLGNTQAEKEHYEWNARTQITTWGDRFASENGQLHDYSHREWNGLLKDFYHKRWAIYFDYLSDKMNGLNPEPADFYAEEEKWTKEKKVYPSEAQGDPIETSRKIFDAAGF